MKINQNQFSILGDVAAALGVSSDTLYKLVDNESGWQPTIKNAQQNSTARGLIQLTDRAAQDLGFKTSLDAISKYPTIEAQLKGIVLPWLKKFGPYKNDADLLLQVFYPVARRMHPMDALPEPIRKANPGILTPFDYVQRALKSKTSALAAFQKTAGGALPVILIIGIGILFLLKRG